MALKMRLALQHADDREAYTAGKSEFIAAVLQQRGKHRCQHSQVP